MTNVTVPPCYVVSVNFQSSHHVEKLLASLETAPFVRWVIVDNSDDDREWIRLSRITGSVPNVHAVRAPSNEGFGSGVNRAVAELAPPDDAVIWILNPDVIVPDGAMEELASKVVRHGADLISPVVATGPTTNPVVWFAGGTLDIQTGTSYHHDWLIPLARRPIIEFQKSTFLSGAALMVRADAWRRLGGFREDFFLYWEDADLSQRAVEAGMRLGVAGHVLVWHEEGGSSSDHGHSRLYFFYIQRNRVRMMRERGIARWRLFAGPAGVETARWLLRPLRESDHRLPKLFASARGLVHGLRS